MEDGGQGKVANPGLHLQVLHGQVEHSTTAVRSQDQFVLHHNALTDLIRHLGIEFTIRAKEDVVADGEFRLAFQLRFAHPVACREFEEVLHEFRAALLEGFGHLLFN
ncbi:MAG: hypothetical protein U0176_08965 [Bacteroidia bacterium]